MLYNHFPLQFRQICHFSSNLLGSGAINVISIIVILNIRNYINANKWQSVFFRSASFHLFERTEVNQYFILEIIPPLFIYWNAARSVSCIRSPASFTSPHFLMARANRYYTYFVISFSILIPLLKAFTYKSYNLNLIRWILSVKGSSPDMFPCGACTRFAKEIVLLRRTANQRWYNIYRYYTMSFQEKTRLRYHLPPIIYFSLPTFFIKPFTCNTSLPQLFLLFDTVHSLKQSA